MITPIKEQDLIDLGFDRLDNDDFTEDFYFYVYDFSMNRGIGLISSGSNEIQNDQWEVYIEEIDDLAFEDLNLLIEFIEVVNKNKKH